MTSYQRMVIVLHHHIHSQRTVKSRQSCMDRVLSEDTENVYSKGQLHMGAHRQRFVFWVYFYNMPAEKESPLTLKRNRDVLFIRCAHKN